ncbi:Prohibitin [Heracleum sosnowskyi]|uniref:Prohibitin n=1 Tax=Heracleum sosnowskyi TaxID=360622 RepID=A0AAD8LZB7_9APIA|nr:Prohibitin [Heracleum sosnowskyi]
MLLAYWLVFPTIYLLVQAVSREIHKILTERAANFNLALGDVSITTLTFGREFTSAIKAKQVAAQEVERAKFLVEKAEQDKRSAIIRAQVRRTNDYIDHYIETCY